MPLIKSKSKKAFSDNVAAEMNAGKPQDQSLAIAYSIKKKAKKKMAYGGMAEDDREPAVPGRKPDDSRLPEDEYMANHFADGGEVNDDLKPYMPSQEEEEASGYPPGPGRAAYIAHKKQMAAEQGQGMAEGGMVDAIMRKRKMMAEGGEVDIQENGNEMPNQYYKQNMDAVKKELYDDSQLDEQPEDSNEHSDDIEKDLHDMVSKIRARMSKKRGM